MQITERAESTLQSERDRLLVDLAREREHLQAAEDRAAGLETQPEQARRPSYARWFG